MAPKWATTLILAVIGGLSDAWIIRTDYPEIDEIDASNGLQEKQLERLNLIFPGTKWCGSGNVAESYDDLGYYADTDACCRDHDHCDDVIEASQTKHNLTNDSFYTRLNCQCDEKFFDCLHRSEDRIGDKVGLVYFSLLGTRCFREDYPIVGCKTWSKVPRRCLEYELDESQPKMYQWFDVPLY